MKNVKFVILVGIVLFMTGIVSGAYGNIGNGKKKDSNISKRNFNTQKKTQIEGIIESVSKVNNGCCQSPGIRLRIRKRNGNRSYDVHLGPDYLFSSNDINFNKGDNVKVDAFEGTFNDQRAYYASKVSSDGKSILLRNDEGEPTWKRGIKSLKQSDGGNGKGRGSGSSGRQGKGKNKGKGRGKR